MKILFTKNIGDFNEVQRASFYSFLYTGLTKEFATFPNPFLGKINIAPKKKLPCLIYLKYNKIKFKYEMIENKEIMKAECFKTNKTEIFLFKHKDLYFNFRIKTLNDALHLRELKDLSTLSLKYSTDFEKYEYFKE